jgi:hypothetical protein
VLGDHQLAPDLAAVGGVRVRRQDGERLVEDALHHVSHAKPAARDEDDLVEP